MSLQDFTSAYIECALWSSNDESRDDGGDPLDANYSEADLAPETRAKIEADCKAFYDANARIFLSATAPIQALSAQAGHDFWLTRNGHGAGFGDGDWLTAPYDLSESAEAQLEAASEAFGTFDLVVGDDGQIWS